jgi:hypothetical protein
MSSEDAPVPVKKPRSEAQIQALDKARAMALELRTQRNVIRQKNNITDETEETPTDDAETENAETESSSTSETESEQPATSVVEKEKPVKKETPKTEPAPKPKPQSKPQQREEHVPIPQNNFRMMSRNQYILFEE